MTKFLYIAAGGAVGAVLRYVVTGLFHQFLSETFPWGTLGVNLIGSFIIGLLWGLFESMTVSENIRMLVFVGILGSFTTFSTFALENLNLLRDNEFRFVFGNIFFSVTLGLILVYMGFAVSRFVGISLKS